METEVQTEKLPHESGINVFDELIDYETKTDLRLKSLTERVSDLEKLGKGNSSDLIDNRMIGFLWLITVAPIIVEMGGGRVP
jgi:hypothetical protein